MKTASGTVAQLTRVDTLGAEADALLLMQWTDGRVFAFPGIEHLPAGSGVEVEIDYLPSDDPGRVPVACAARLLGLPVMMDGEEVMQPARRPVPIFSSDSAACS
ncbi:MAG: hypothetical protein ACXIUM_06130 [Wenzhouxiangella sp.]